MRTLAKMTSFTLASPIKLRDVSDLAGAIELEFPRLWAHVMREMSGPYANPAAASDILRLCILHREGGVYIDTDIGTKDITRSTRHGGGSLNFGQLASHAGLLIRTDGKRDRPGAPFKMVPECNNDLLASVQGAEVLREAIRNILHAYESAPREVVWVDKRSDLHARILRTLTMSGPSGLLHGLVHRLPRERAFQAAFRRALDYVRAHPERLPPPAEISAPVEPIEAFGYGYTFDAPAEHRAAWVLAFEATIRFPTRGLRIRNDKGWLPGRGLPPPRSHEAPE